MQIAVYQDRKQVAIILKAISGGVIPKGQIGYSDRVDGAVYNVLGYWHTGKDSTSRTYVLVDVKNYDKGAVRDGWWLILEDGRGWGKCNLRIQSKLWENIKGELKVIRQENGVKEAD